MTKDLDNWSKDLIHALYKVCPSVFKLDGQFIFLSANVQFIRTFYFHYTANIYLCFKFKSFNWQQCVECARVLFNPQTGLQLNQLKCLIK